MKLIRNLTVLCLGSMLLAACGESGSQPAAEAEKEAESTMKQLTGEAFYRERILLPPGALLTVVLEDVSRMDAPATVLAEFSEAIDGAPPYAFTLDYAPDAIEERMRYNVRATIREGDRLRFTSTTSTDPFKLAADEPLRIMMSSTGGSPARSAVEPDRDMRVVVSRNPAVELEGTHWRLVALGGADVTQPEDPQREAYFMLDAESGMAGGFGSCNNFRGSYTIKGNELGFGPLAGTLKMCADFMELEKGLMESLAATAWFSINEKMLVLLGEDKKPIATFEAVE